MGRGQGRLRRGQSLLGGPLMLFRRFQLHLQGGGPSLELGFEQLQLQAVLFIQVRACLRRLLLNLQLDPGLFGGDGSSAIAA